MEEAREAAQGGVRPETEEERRAAEELAERQRQIREELLQLAKLNEEREDGKPLDSLKRAEQSAQQASEQLDRGELGEAQPSEEDVQKAVEEALSELEEEEDEYQSLRDEELLFQIKEEVTSMLAAHAVVMESTRELDAARTPGERLGRAQRLRARRLGQDESAIAARCDELATAIEEEQALVFAELLRAAEQDLQRVAIELGDEGDYATGLSTQALQDQVARTFEWLLEALTREEQRRREERQQEQQQGGGQGGGPQGENRLVPDEAELKLLRRMELDVVEQVELLLGLHGAELSGDDVDPLLLREVQRLADRHEQVTILFGKLRERLGLPEPQE